MATRKSPNRAAVFSRFGVIATDNGHFLAHFIGNLVFSQVRGLFAGVLIATGGIGHRSRYFKDKPCQRDVPKMKYPDASIASTSILRQRPSTEERTHGATC
jgi:hypothetical protein